MDNTIDINVPPQENENPQVSVKIKVGIYESPAS